MDRFPAIDWLEPQPVETPAGRWLTCRLCTALHGLKAQDLPRVGFTAREDWERHVREVHSLPGA
jgi:hypothetical protein